MGIKRGKNEKIGLKQKIIVSAVLLFFATGAFAPALAASKEGYFDSLRNNFYTALPPGFPKISLPSAENFAGIFDTIGGFFRRAVSVFSSSRDTPEVDGKAIREKNILSSAAIAVSGG